MSKIQDALAKIQREKQLDAAAEPKPNPLGQINETRQEKALDLASGASLRDGYNGPFVELDVNEIRDVGLLGPEDKERELQDEYRQIKRPLLKNAHPSNPLREDNANVIMVCSAESGEGKSFTSINLSFSLALERDVEVLLIDADILKPQLSELFGLRGQRGLTDLLEDESLRPEDVISKTDNPKLSIMPSGAPHRLGTELLSSGRMRQLAEQFFAANKQRIILIDSSPLLSTTEAVAMTNWVGQILMVVKAGATERAKVAQAIELLDQDKPINLVLNQADTSRFSVYYGYGYGYGNSEAEG